MKPRRAASGARRIRAPELPSTMQVRAKRIVKASPSDHESVVQRTIPMKVWPVIFGYPDIGPAKRRFRKLVDCVLSPCIFKGWCAQSTRRAGLKSSLRSKVPRFFTVLIREHRQFPHAVAIRCRFRPEHTLIGGHCALIVGRTAIDRSTINAIPSWSMWAGHSGHIARTSLSHASNFSRNFLGLA